MTKTNCRPLLLAAACLVWSAAARAADWPQYGFDASHTSASPEVLPAGMSVRWALDLPRPKPAWLDQPRMDFDDGYYPLVVGGLVIVASPADDTVCAYRLADGRLQWRFFTGGPVRLPPASDGVRVFAGSDDGWLYALGIEQGDLLWRFKGAPRPRLVLGNGRLIDTWCVRGGPVVADGQVYFAAGIWPFMGVFLHALDAATGRPVWSNSGDGAEYQVQPHGALSFAGIAPQGTLAVSGPRLLVPGGRTLPACYDRRTGKRMYYDLATKTGDHDVAANDRYFFCAGTAYDLAAGKAVAPAPGNPVIAGSDLFGTSPVGLTATGLAALAAAARPAGAAPPAAPWSKLLAKGGPKAGVAVKFPEATALIKAGGRLYAGGKGSIAAFELPLSPGRPPAWQAPVEGPVAAITAGNGHLLVALDSGRLICFGAGPACPVVPAIQAAAPAKAAVERAEAILKDSGATAGYALALGAECGELARALAAASRLHVVVLEADAVKVRSLRAALHAAGAYGDRVAVVSGDLASAPLPPYFASLVVADAAALPAGAEWCPKLFHVLHPYGGRAYLRLKPEQRQALARFAAGDLPGKAELSEAAGGTRLVRGGGLPGAGQWTHEHADASNTRVSPDRLVKAPLGLLWYGGSDHGPILPRHGHGPQPQVLDGRLVIEMADGLRSIDIYTGRVLWEASLPGLGGYYNVTTHHFGANGAGTNYVSTPDAIYVRYYRECRRLDPATGKPLAGFALPEPLGGQGRIWGCLNVAGDYLIGGAAVPDSLHLLYKWAQVGRGGAAAERPRREEPARTGGGSGAPQAIESLALFVMDRHSGKLLWSAAAQDRFRHNAVCAGGGRLYAIDRPAAGAKLFPAAGPPSAAGRLAVFDLATGKPVWRRDRDVFGTWLSYSARHDVLLEAGFCSRDALRDEPRGVRAYAAADGRVLWHAPKAAGPAMILGDWVLQDQAALGILDGKPVRAGDPVTGEPREWRWTRAYGCNTPAASEHLLLFRSGAAGFYDLARLGGTGNWGGFRSSCTNNLIAAGGILTVPEYTRTCACSYQNQTSLALAPDSDAEMWTYQGFPLSGKGPVRRLGVNFGAPGNRLDDRGVLWLEHPQAVDLPTKAAAAPPRPTVELKPASSCRFFRRHASVVSGPMPWVCASGVEGVESVRLALADPALPGRRYTVRLYFSEPDDLQPGERRFNVAIQGREAQAGLDVAKESGGPRRGLVREFPGVEAAGDLLLAFCPLTARPAILCGIEVLAEE